SPPQAYQRSEVATRKRRMWRVVKQLSCSCEEVIRKLTLFADTVSLAEVARATTEISCSGSGCGVVGGGLRTGASHHRDYFRRRTRHRWRRTRADRKCVIHRQRRAFPADWRFFPGEGPAGRAKGQPPHNSPQCADP